MRVALVVWSCALVASSCQKQTSDGEKVENPAPTPPAPVPVQIDAAQKARFERLTVVDYNWEIGGSNILVVDASGAVSFVGAVGERQTIDGQRVTVPVWHRVEWRLAEGDMQVLARALDTVGFAELEPLYIDRNVDDGQNVTYRVATTAGTHSVRCSNQFPPAIRTLRTLLRERILGERDGVDSLRQGTRLSAKEHEALERAYETEH